VRRLVRHSAIVTTLTTAAAPGFIAWTVFAYGHGEVRPAPDDAASYNLESRAAIGAHHLCPGLWVVGRGYRRTAAEVLAQDIAPFKDFSWDNRFTYRVDSEQHTVTVSGPGAAPRTAVCNGDQGWGISS
jgi:hypothetical protein